MELLYLTQHGLADYVFYYQEGQKYLSNHPTDTACSVRPNYK